MIIVLLAIVTILLIGISGLMAAAETAIGSASRHEIEQLAERSPRIATALRAIADDPSAHLNALTFARVLLETVTVVLTTLILGRLFTEEWQGFLLAVGVLILVSFIITSASPRSVARANALRVLKTAAKPIRVCRMLVGPLADLLVAIGDRVTPGRPGRAGALTSERQLLSMVDEAAEDDVLEDEDRQLIHAVIDFSGTLVREVMVARTDMVTIDHDVTAREALEELLKHGFSRAPVIGKDSDDVLGIVYTKDLARSLLTDEQSTATAVSIARDARFVPESLGAEPLLRDMQREATHVAIVIDEYGGVAGLVTLEDLIEELVGDIADEYDRGHREYERLDDGTLRVWSRMSIADLAELLGRELDDGDVDSVGGLLQKALGTIPDPGERATALGLELTAERVGRRGRIETIIVRELTDDELDNEALHEDDVVEQALHARATQSMRERTHDTNPAERA